MNRKDIIRMANKAYGIDEKGKPFHPSALLHLEIFANLVASAEREACADVCISLANRWSQMGAWGSSTEFHQCAEAIRARGQA